MDVRKIKVKGVRGGGGRPDIPILYILNLRGNIADQDE